MIEKQPNNRRGFARQPNSSSIVADWTEEGGGAKRAEGRCVDISVSGLSYETVTPIAAGTMIEFTVPELRLTGKGVVRYSADSEALYRVAIAFSAVEWDYGGVEGMDS